MAFAIQIIHLKNSRLQVAGTMNHLKSMDKKDSDLFQNCMVETGKPPLNNLLCILETLNRHSVWRVHISFAEKMFVPIPWYALGSAAVEVDVVK